MDLHYSDSYSTATLPRSNLQGNSPQYSRPRASATSDGSDTLTKSRSDPAYRALLDASHRPPQHAMSETVVTEQEPLLPSSEDPAERDTEVERSRGLSRGIPRLDMASTTRDAVGLLAVYVSDVARSRMSR